VTYAETYRYFSAPKELQRRNSDYANRLMFIAGQYKAKAGTFRQLISAALRKWPLS
jgi:hypothetical protein